MIREVVEKVKESYVKLSRDNKKKKGKQQIIEQRNCLVKILAATNPSDINPSSSYLVPFHMLVACKFASYILGPYSELKLTRFNLAYEYI
jgi:hypothetical protein